MTTRTTSPMRRFSRGLTVALLGAALVTTACAKKEERVLFNGFYFPAKAKVANKEERKMFRVTVRRADQDAAGALEAGRHEGKRYCLKNYGTSEINWSQGPDDTGAASYFNGGSLSLSGTCVLW